MTSSGSIPVTPLLGAVLAVLLVATAAVVTLGGYERARSVLTAGLRGTAQLVVVALIITQVVRQPWLIVAFLLLMFAVAARTAGRRITTNSTWWWACVPIAAGVLPAVALVLLTGAVPVTGLVVIPLVGQLIGGALTATALAGRRLLEELTRRWGEVEAGLAIGLTMRSARLEIVRPVAGAALMPALDQTRTVGTVTLPGAFVGMLLGGASPIEAGAVQLFVLIALLAVESIAILVVLELVGRGVLNRSETANRVHSSRWRIRR